MTNSNIRIPTKETYDALQSAYDFYNRKLFDGKLDDCLITLNRKRGTRGYFHAKIFQDRYDHHTQTDEIALNPVYFDRTIEEVLSTLVHEMVHLWQEQYGKPGRGRYHNKEWGNKMEELGLMPTSTGLPGGKRTGDRVTHYIIPDGHYDMVTKILMNEGFKLHWQEVPQLIDDDEDKKTKKKKTKQTRLKYLCPNCEAAAWGGTSLLLICGKCHIPMVKKDDEDDSDS